MQKVALITSVAKVPGSKKRFSPVVMTILIGLLVIGLIVYGSAISSKQDNAVNHEQQTPLVRPPEPDNTPVYSSVKAINGEVKYRDKSGRVTQSKKLAEVPFYQFGEFHSSRDVAILKYSPYGTLFASSAAGAHLASVSFELGGKDLGRLKDRTDRHYQLDGWQYDKSRQTAYAYNCKYNPGVCTHVVKISSDKRRNYKFNDFTDEAIYPDKNQVKTPANSYRSWRFSLSGDGKLLFMASDYELLVYDTNKSSTPLLRQILPEGWRGYYISRIVSNAQGSRLFIAYTKAGKYGDGFQGFVVELQKAKDEYRVVTRFADLPNPNPMSGMDIAVNDSGDLVAIGEYVNPAKDSDSYSVLGTKVEVTLAQPTISIWHKNMHGDWTLLQTIGENRQENRAASQVFSAPVLVRKPNNVSFFSPRMSMATGNQLVIRHSVNRDFQLNDKGDLLLTGLDVEKKRQSIAVNAGLYSLSAAQGTTKLMAKLA